MDGVARNIRYLLWKEGEERRNWETRLSTWLGCTSERANALLEGEGKPLTAKEGEILTRKTGLKPSELSGDLPAVQEVDVLTENIRFLISTLPHGEKKKFAEKLGIDVTTVSRWIKGAQRPTRTNLRQIGDYFGLPPDTDLKAEDVFLWTRPIGESQIKNWISEKVAQLDGKTLREMYPTLKRLFR
jgi:transcriptional regulator with XRE-family HTH domain